MVSLEGEILIYVNTEKGNSCSLNAFNCYNFHSLLRDNFGQFAILVREWNNSFHEIIKGSKSCHFLQKQEVYLEEFDWKRLQTFHQTHVTLKMLGGSIGQSFLLWLIIFFGQWSSQISASWPQFLLYFVIGKSKYFSSVFLVIIFFALANTKLFSHVYK